MDCSCFVRFEAKAELVENNAPADVTEQGKEEVEQEYVANNAHQPIDEPLGDEIEQNIDVQDSVDINDAIQIYSYGPEEDVDITYHETNIEVTDAENIIVNDNELGLEQDRVEYNEIREFSEENNGYYLTNDEEERDVVVEKETENEDHTNEENASDEVSAMDSDRYNIELPDQTSTFDISSENLNFVEIEEEISEDGETETMHKENNDFVTSELEEIFEEQIGIPEDISEANIQEREEYDKVVEEMEEIENENISDKNEYHLEPKYTVEQEKEEIGIVEKDPETQFEEAEEEWLEEEDSVREAEQETNEAIVDEMYQFETTTIKEPKYTVEQEKEEIGIVEKDPETQFEETEEEWLEENDSVREAEQETNEAIVDEMYQFETTTIKESGWFDKEDTVGEDEDVDRNRMLFEEIEPPGYMTDIQMFPFQASKHEVRTEEDAVCSLVAATGPCRAYFRRYFFNSKTQECDIFVYGGCIGNGNNFKTSLDCENTCMNNMNSLSNNDINIKTEPL